MSKLFCDTTPVTNSGPGESDLRIQELDNSAFQNDGDSVRLSGAYSFGGEGDPSFVRLYVGDFPVTFAPTGSGDALAFPNLANVTLDVRLTRIAANTLLVESDFKSNRPEHFTQLLAAGCSDSPGGPAVLSVDTSTDIEVKSTGEGPSVTQTKFLGVKE